MESTQSSEALRELERAEAAAYIHYRPSPRWWIPAFALWMAVLIAVQDWWSELGEDRSVLSTIALIAVLAGLAGALAAWSAWYPRYYGSMPRMLGRKPVEIRRVYWSWVAAYGIAIAAIVTIGRAQPWWVSGLAAFAIASVLMAWYERRYDRAAQQARDRLG